MQPIARTGGRAAEAAPVRLNLVLLAALLLLHAAALILLPLLLLPRHPAWAALLLPSVLATTTHWALLHEAVHRLLHPDVRINDALGRLLSIAFGAPYRLLRTGHLIHHRLNGRAVERPEIYDPARRSPLAARLAYYPQLFFGLYAAELAALLLAFLPRPAVERLVRRMFYGGRSGAAGADHLAVRRILGRGGLGEVRRDAAAVLLLYGAAFAAFGSDLPLLAAALVGRAALVSFLDNAFHYGAPLGDPRQAHDLELPAWAARLILNFNLHRAHHRRPTLPWRALPADFAAGGGGYEGHFVLVPLRQLRGPIPLACPDLRGRD